MRKRLIYRCDDVGYTPTYDLGLFEVIDTGIGCSADVMFDATDTVEALKKIMERPWLSVGWHRHLWERPVLPAEEVPSLVDENGRFKWGHRNNHFKLEATYEDAYKEFDAEMKLCYSVLKRYPDVAGVASNAEEVPLEQAFKDICEKYNIATNYYVRQPEFNHKKKMNQSDKDFSIMKKTLEHPLDTKWADKNIISCSIYSGASYDLKELENYRPITALTNLKWTEKEEIYFYGWHPGFLDSHILAESTCSVHRIKEYDDALSAEFRNWIIDNKIELINFRDALYDTNEFQDHLKEINSPLWIGNMK